MKRWHKVIIIFVAVLLFAASFSALKAEQFYREAAALYDKGLYISSREQYLELGGYRDSVLLADRCLLSEGELLLSQDRPDEAVGLLAQISDGQTSALLLDALFTYAQKTDPAEALALCEGPLLGREDALELADSIRRAQLEEALTGGDYSRAAELCGLLSDPTEREELLGRTRAECYAALLDQFERTGQAGEGFSQPLLDGYEQADLYEIYGQLQRSEWSDDQYAENVELCWQLGDFLNTAASGFLFERLCGHRFGSNSGYYFTVEDSGNVSCNLPRLFYFGYWGLYGRFADGIYYIGSDEKAWSRQFAFTFGEADATLTVYSYASGRSYELTRRY